MEREISEKRETDLGGNHEPGGNRPPVEQPGRRKKPPRKKWQYAAGFLILGICCMAGAAEGVCLSRVKEPAKPEGLVYEASIVMGDTPDKTPEERQREPNSMVEEGMITMSINATPSGKTAGAGRNVNWLIENPSNQGKLIRVVVALTETGEKIYETGAIPPGSYVMETPLDVRLEAGVYPCTVMLYAYREDDEVYVGQAAVELKLTLLE